MKIDLKSFAFGILIIVLISAGTITSGIISFKPATAKEVKVLSLSITNLNTEDTERNKMILTKYLLKGFVITNTIPAGEGYSVVVVMSKY